MQSTASRFSPAFLRASAIISICLLLCGGVISFWALNVTEQQRHNYGNNYGQALANVAAYQAQEATLDHDLLSLQIILEDIAKNPAVIGSTIHNVENSLVVQAGHNPDIRRQLRDEQILGSYNAPITLQDSVAGYVTVILALPESHNTALISKICLLVLSLLALTLWLLYRLIFRDNSNITTLPIVVSQGQDSPQESNIAVLNTSDSAHLDDNFDAVYPVQLRLNLHLLGKLKQQLNGKHYKQLLAQFERQVRGVCSLYNGELTFAGHNELLLRFSANAETDATFNALCSAKLLQSLTLQGDIELQLNAHIRADDQTLSQQLKNKAADVLLSVQDDLINPEIARRAQFDGQQCLQLEAPWSELLRKQQRQLQRLSES